MQRKLVSKQTAEKIAELLKTSDDFVVIRYNKSGVHIDLKELHNEPQNSSIFLLSYLFHNEPRLKKLILEMTQALEYSVNQNNNDTEKN